MSSSRRGLLAPTCWAAFLAHALGVTAFGPLVTILQGHFDISKAAVATLMAAGAGGFLATVILGARLTERWGSLPLLRVGCLGLALGLLGFGRTTTLAGALAFQLVLGCSGGLLQMSANALVSTAFPVSRALQLNLLHLFFGLGAVIGPRLVPWVLGRGMAWGQVFWFSSGACLLAVLLSLGSAAPPSGPVRAARSIRPGSPMLRRMLLLILLYVGAEISINNWIPALVQETKGLDLAAAAAGIGDFWLALALGRLLCAPLARRVGGRLMLRVLPVGMLVFTSLLLMAEAPWLIRTALVMTGLACSGIFPTVLALAGDAEPDRIPGVTASVMTAASVSAMLLPWLVGVLGSAYGLPRGFYLVLALEAGLVWLGWPLVSLRSNTPVDKQQVHRTSRS